MTYCFDVDGTLCETDGEDYANAKPIWPRIDKVKALMLEGHTVIFYTARGQGTGTADTWLPFTADQLRDWGLAPGHVLALHPKPFADVYVDDRAFNSEDFFA